MDEKARKRNLPQAYCGVYIAPSRKKKRLGKKEVVSDAHLRITLPDRKHTQSIWLSKMVRAAWDVAPLFDR